MKVSIIIPTVNRARYLEGLIESLAKQTYSDFELVFVPATQSTDNTFDVLAKYAGRIKVVPSPVISLGVQRNLGIAHASGEIVAFIDDDAIPESDDWIETAMNVFRQNPQVSIVSGEVINFQHRHSEFKRGLTSAYGFQVFNATEQQAAELVHKHHFLGIAGGNAFYRREVLLKLGGYDPKFQYYLDETDMAARVQKAGYKVVYADAMAILHYNDKTHLKSIHNRTYQDWHIITSADTYFGLKHGIDALPIRMLKVLYFAPQKHFFREITGQLRQGEIGLIDFLRFLLKWKYGIVRGFWLYFTSGRSDLVDAQNEFLVFRA